MARQFKPGQLQTGSLFNISSSYALTASFALNAGGGGSSFPYTGSARITGSLAVTGSVIATAGFIGSLQGIATTATNADNAGHATTATTADQPKDDWIPAKPDPNGISPYSLGSPTSWWNSLYVGHGTIYFMSQSVGQPTTSASISIKDNAFTFNTTDAQGNTSETVISNAGTSLAVSASIAQTASYVSPTFISQSAAASGFGAGGGGSSFPYTGSALITGSLGITGSTSIRGTLNQASASLATGLFAHAQGFAVTATGNYSHAEGAFAVATGAGSHAEGFATTATGNYSHAEGASTTALGNSSHAEGNTTTATGEGSHAEGSSTVANGQYSHAEGLGTIAQGAYQHVQGQYNQSSSAQGAFIVGNGTGPESLRSNLIFASGSQVQITGSVIATAGFTGSLQGIATTSISASYAATASFFSGSVSNAVSASYALTASFVQNAQTASFINPTFISQSAAASGFGAGGGGSITYVSSSNNPLSEIEVADYDNNVAVTYVNGRLKFIFGTPTAPSAPVASFNSTFRTDRFNKVTDAYTVTGTISVGGYTLISASLYEGGVLLTSTGSNATQLLYSTTTSGSHTYVLHVTASSPLDNSLNIQSASLSGTLSKTNPGVPTITPTATVQLGTAASLQIEQGATGSITFTSASGTANDWVHNFTSTNVTSPIFVTGSATGSSSITITATSYYSSSGVLGADNFLALATTSTTTTTYTKIRSVRYGVSAATAFTSTQLENLATWDTTIGGTIGRVVKGTTNPHTYQFTITTSGQYIYIVVDSTYSLTGILNVNNSNSNDLGVFTATTIGNYKVYRSNNISATTILYELRTS